MRLRYRETNPALLLSEERLITPPFSLRASQYFPSHHPTMGLDSVELLMAIEDEFKLTISDQDAEDLAILGDMHAYVLRSLRQRGEAPDEQQIWERLKRVVIYQLGVKPHQVTPTTDVIRDLGVD